MGVVFRCDWCGREVEIAINPQRGTKASFTTPDGWFCRWSQRKEAEEIACGEACAQRIDEAERRLGEQAG
ncbi:MAG: hypothetical protein KIS87_12945 [Phycisphaeraceae bacterium]|nr:hypothetical protein [Phycisphaeraceae bacterium]